MDICDTRLMPREATKRTSIHHFVHPFSAHPSPSANSVLVHPFQYSLGNVKSEGWESVSGSHCGGAPSASCWWLTMLHNGRHGLGPADVAAVCSINRSRKRLSRAAIGKKGIGFKSYFQVTDRPEMGRAGQPLCNLCWGHHASRGHSASYCAPPTSFCPYPLPVRVAPHPHLV